MAGGKLAVPFLLIVVLAVAFMGTLNVGTLNGVDGTSSVKSSSSMASPPTQSSSVAVAEVIIVPGGAIGNRIEYYYPENLTVVIGFNNTVTWTNDDMFVNSVDFTGIGVYSGYMRPSTSWSYTFTAPGTFSYHCIFHPWMQGTVTVKGNQV